MNSQRHGMTARHQARRSEPHPRARSSSGGVPRTKRRRPILGAILLLYGFGILIGTGYEFVQDVSRGNASYVSLVFVLGGATLIGAGLRFMARGRSSRRSARLSRVDGAIELQKNVGTTVTDRPSQARLASASPSNPAKLAIGSSSQRLVRINRTRRYRGSESSYIAHLALRYLTIAILWFGVITAEDSDEMTTGVIGVVIFGLATLLSLAVCPEREDGRFPLLKSITSSLAAALPIIGLIALLAN